MTSVSSGQLRQQCPGFLQAFCLKPFSEPAGDLRQPPYCSEHRVEGNIRGGGVLSAPIRETSSHVLPYSPPSLSRSIGPAAASQYATSAPSPHTGQWWSAGCDEKARK